MQPSLGHLVSPFSGPQLPEWLHFRGRGKGSLEILVASYSLLDSSLKQKLSSSSTVHESHLRELRNEVRDAGGLLVTGKVEGQGMVLDIEIMPGPTGAQAADRAWVVTRSGKLEDRRLDDRSLYLRWGEYVILPMLETDLQAFESLKDMLGYFPADRRAAIYHALSQPDLETRVRFLEQTRRQSWPIKIWLACLITGVAVLIAGLVAGSLLSSNGSDSTPPGMPDAAAATDAGPTESSSGTSANGSGEPKDAGPTTEELKENVEAKGKEIAELLKEAGKGSTWFKIYAARPKKGKNALGVTSRPTATTMAKLVAHMHGIPLNDEAITASDFPWKLGERLKEGAKDRLSLDSFEVTILSWQYCGFPAESDLYAGFRWETGKGQKKEKHKAPFNPESTDCDDFRDDPDWQQISDAYGDFHDKLRQAIEKKVK